MITTILACRSSPDTAAAMGPEVVAIENLCTQPELISEQAVGTERLVLALHRRDYSLAEVQAQARLLGLDPFGVQIVHLKREPSPDLAVTLAGLAARAEAFTGSEPEHAKAAYPKRVSRRALLTFPKPEYVAAPFVDQQTCAAADGCQACADICPQEAYRWADGRIHFNKDACEPCGRCITTCPTGAITNPSVTPAQLQAQIETILSLSASPVGVAFVCQRGRPRLPAGWQAVTVPCTGMVPGTWLIATLLLGAAAATALPCKDTGCNLQQDEPTNERVWFARSLLARAGKDPDHVPRVPGGHPSMIPIGSTMLQDPFGLHGPVEVVLALMSLEGRRTNLQFDHPGAPMGRIDIDPATCTACMTCATTCPTGALNQHFTGDRVELSFDASLCTACGQCISRCPELERGAISLTTTVDTRLLAMGRDIVHESPVNQCESCGNPVAPQATLERLGALLGPDHSPTLEYLSTRCLDCRGKW